MATRTSTASKADKADKQELYLLVVEEFSSFGGERYYKQTARVVTQKYESGKGYVPYGVDDTYGDGPFYSGLRFNCQGDERSRTDTTRNEPVYGFGYSDDVGYSDVYRVELRLARRMVKTLERIDKTLARVRETRGHVRSWGEQLGRVAEALGCAGIGFEKSQRSRAVTGCSHDWYTIGEGVNQANHRVQQWQHPEEEAERRQLQAATVESDASDATEGSER
jgi:hypothetical protein